MTILFTGGGTMGPVTPLLAVLRKMRGMRKDISFAWAGTPDGPEKAVISDEDIPFYGIPVAKVPRFLSLRLGTFPLDYGKARKAARDVLEKTSPSLVVSAGAFSSVAVMHEASKRGIACATHQLDYTSGLANRIMARWCDTVTTSFAYDRPPFGGKGKRIATPCRFAGSELPTRAGAAERLGLDPSVMTLFVFGGGTGALALNEAIVSVLGDLCAEYQVIHLTGRGKGDRVRKKRYQSHAFFDEGQMLDAYAASDLVVCRAGLGTISELACLKKPAILVPIPHSHQEKNAAQMPFPVVEQHGRFAESLLDEVRRVADDGARLRRIGDEAHSRLPTDDGAALAETWLSLV